MGGSCDYGEPVDCYSERKPKSLGTVKCDDCRRVIPKGVKYLAQKFRSEGTWRAVACCPDCDATVEYLNNAGAECLYHGALGDWISELSPHDFRKGGDYDDCPRLSPCVTYAFARWAEDYELDPVTLEPKP